MRVLITGGNGYVGRTLTRRLYGEHDVMVVDTIRGGAVRFDEDELGRFSIERVDIRDTPALQSVMDSFRPEVVIHLAAIHFIPECERLPQDAVGINTLGTVSVLTTMPASARLVWTSTAAVYAPEAAAHDEVTSSIGPMDVYGLTKLHAEEFVRYFARLRNLDARTVRLFNVVGPGETNPHLLPAILAQVTKGDRVLRLGNTTPRRDYIHVQDVADGLAAVAFAPPVVAEGEVDVVNLGTGEEWSVDDVVRMLSEVAGEPLAIETDPERVRAVDRPHLLASRRRIADHYGWQPARSLKDALADLWSDPDVPRELLERS